MSDAEREAHVKTASADELALLMADSIVAQQFVQHVAHQLIDQAVRTRWLDHGKDDFAVAYRKIGSALPDLPQVRLPLDADGYRAEIDAEREANATAIAHERQMMERTIERELRSMRKLLDALLEEFGEGAREVYLTYKEQERQDLSNGVLSPHYIPEQ
jgi:hypothetical protein